LTPRSDVPWNGRVPGQAPAWSTPQCAGGLDLLDGIEGAATGWWWSGGHSERDFPGTESPIRSQEPGGRFGSWPGWQSRKPPGADVPPGPPRVGSGVVGHWIQDRGRRAPRGPAIGHRSPPGAHRSKTEICPQAPRDVPGPECFQQALGRHTLESTPLGSSISNRFERMRAVPSGLPGTECALLETSAAPNPRLPAALSTRGPGPLWTIL